MRAKLVLLLASTGLTLLALEGAARLNLLPLPDSVLTSDAWWEERWHREREGMNPRELIELDRELGYVPAAGLHDLPYDGARVSTNSAHMRGAREIPRERDGAPRVVAVGDSYTFGQCVDDDETYPAVIGRVLPGTEVLNLGVMGYGQDQALLRLLRDGLPYQPDAVVFGFHPSNPRRNMVSFRGWAKPRFRLEQGELVLENVPVPEPADYAGLWPPRLWNYVRIFRDSLEAESPEAHHEMMDLSRAIVVRMARETQARGIPLFVVHLPHPSALEQEGEQGWAWMEQLCADPKPAPFRCVSPVPRFRRIASTPEAVRRHFDCHYSRELYAAVGEAVAEALHQDLPGVFPDLEETHRAAAAPSQATEAAANPTPGSGEAAGS